MLSHIAAVKPVYIKTDFTCSIMESNLLSCSIVRLYTVAYTCIRQRMLIYSDVRSLKAVVEAKLSTY